MGCTLLWIVEVAHLIYVCCTMVLNVGFTTSWLMVVLRFSFFAIGGEGFSSSVQCSREHPLIVVLWHHEFSWYLVLCVPRTSQLRWGRVLCPRPKWGQEAAEIRPLSPHWRGFKGLAATPCLWGHGCPCRGPMDPLVIGCWCIHEIVVDACSRRAQWRFMCWTYLVSLSLLCWVCM